MCDRNPNEIPCRQKPCIPRQRPPSEEDPNALLKGRPVLYTGVVWIGLVRRFLIPRTCCGVQRAGEAQASDEAPQGPSPRQVHHAVVDESALHEPPLRYKQKPLPVPLVTEKFGERQVGEPAATEDPKAALLRRQGAAAGAALEGDSGASPLRALVVQVGEASSAAVTQAKQVITEDLSAILRDGQETTAEVIETVRGEDGRRFRLAVVSAGGVLGYLAGLRRGAAARLVYSATGAAAVAAVCYPDDTKAYNRRGLAAVRRWMVLGLSFLHSEPQKPLGCGDMRIANNPRLLETISSDSTEESETSSIAGENLLANLMENLGSFGNFLEKIKAKVNESSVTIEENESSEDDAINLESHGDFEITSDDSNESLPPLKTDRLENLSSKNNTGVMKDLPPSSVPYSPALPAPPKVSSSRHKVNIIPAKPEEDLSKINMLEEPLALKKKKSRDYLYPQETDELSNEADETLSQSDEDDESGFADDEGQLEEDMDLDNVFVIPTGGLEEKLMDGRQEDGIQNTGHKKSTKCPLNKKLVAYYKNMPEEEKTSREKGYDDAYSNRGK